MDETGRAIMWAIVATALIMAPIFAALYYAEHTPTVLTADAFARIW